MTNEASPSPSVVEGGGGIAQTAVPAVPGRLSEAYDVQKAVGKGGYAIVYKGVRREDGRIIAVKKVEIFEMSQKKRDRCLQEVTLLAQLSHPYIIQMLDAFIDENMLIIIFEWAPAGDLKRLIKKTSEAGKTLDEPAIWGFFSQIVDGLRYMHAHRIMHRDIKPANVLVGANGALKLGDLGLGRQLSEQTMEAFSKVGTPYYVSPEVVRGAGYDWKSDVWSLGCLLYELACLRSPFEMEGANLYDVFQRISKGDYDALPDEQFSPTLRNLVARMLSVDPAGRPELEEVWRISQGSLQAQAKARVDVHTAAERIYEQLMLLEALSAAPVAAPEKASEKEKNGKTSKSGRSSSAKRSASKELVGVVVPPPPTATLRALHPAYFAESLAALPGGSVAGLRALGQEEAQRQQLGAFLQVFAWLLRVGGWQELAGPVEEHVEMRAPPARAAGRSGGGGAQRAGVAVCTNLLKGAEAARRAAQVAGVPTEFAPVTAVAAGYGRATCTLLQDLLDASAKRVPLIVAKPRHKGRDSARGGRGSRGGGGGETAEDGDGASDDGGADGGLCVDDGDDALLTAASPLPAAYRADGEDEETVEALWGSGGRGGGGDAGGTAGGTRPGSRSGADVGKAPRPGSRGEGGGRSGSRGGAGAEAGRPGHERIASQRGPPLPPPLPSQYHQVDPVAWRKEAERLAPQLSRIKISASALAAGGLGEWAVRWERVRGALKALQQDAPPTLAAMERLAVGVGEQLERVAVSERRLNGAEGVSTLLEALAARRERLTELRQDVLAHEDLQQAGQAALAQLADKLSSVQTQLDEKANGMDGSLPVKQLKDALATVRRELGQLEVRLGVVKSTLLSRARKHQLVGSHLREADNDEHYTL